MSSDSIEYKGKVARFCPYCGSTNIVVWDELLTCRKCHRQSAAFEMDFDQQEY